MWEPVKFGNVDRLILQAWVEDLVRVLRPVVVVSVLPGARPQPLSVVEGQDRVGFHLDAAEETRAGERNLSGMENSNFRLVAKYRDKTEPIG